MQRPRFAPGIRTKLLLVLTVMLIMSGMLLVWTRRKGWW